MTSVRTCICTKISAGLNGGNITCFGAVHVMSVFSSPLVNMVAEQDITLLGCYHSFGPQRHGMIAIDKHDKTTHL
jgi:hypothetical protein